MPYFPRTCKLFDLNVRTKTSPREQFDPANSYCRTLFRPGLAMDGKSKELENTILPRSSFLPILKVLVRHLPIKKEQVGTISLTKNEPDRNDLRETITERNESSRLLPRLAPFQT